MGDKKIEVKIIGGAGRGASPSPADRLSSQIEYKTEASDFFDEDDAKRLDSWSSAKGESLKLTDKETGVSVCVLPHPVSFEDLAMLYHMEATHYSCVALKSAVVGGGSWKLSTPHSDAQNIKRLLRKAVRRDQVGDVPEEIQRFFDAPNPEKSVGAIIRDGEVDFQTTGNAYVEIVRALNGAPKEIYNVVSYTVYVIDREATAELNDLSEELIPDYCQFIRDKAESAAGKLSFYRTAGKPEPTEFLGQQVSEIVHMKEYSPMTEDYGLPSILAALNQLLIIRSALKYRHNLFQDEGIGPTVFHFEGAEALSPDDEHILQHYIDESLHLGKGKILAIPTSPGVKLNIHKLSMMADLGADMIRELLTPMRDEILRVHRVPPRLVSVADTRGLGGSAEALAQMEQFQAMVIDARQQMWMSLFNKHILHDGFGRGDISFKLMPISLRSLLDLQRYYVGWLDRGVLNIDDVRDMALGLDPLPDGQGKPYRITMGGQPVDLADTKPGPKPGQTVAGMDSENSEEIN